MSAGDDDVLPMFPEGRAAKIIATISPVVDAEGSPGSPVFTTKSRYNAEQECQHKEYELDAKWQTVHCATCGVRLEPFAVLQRYEEFVVQIQRMHQHAVAAEQSALAEQLRAIRNRVALNEADRKRIDEAIGWSAARNHEPGALRRLLREMEDKVFRAQMDRRVAKRS